MMKYLLFIPLMFFVNFSQGICQHTGSTIPALEIRSLVQKLKSDARGPYKDIRWFCPDGSILPPKEKCKDPGGYQRARYKDEVVQLGKDHHIFLGQILKGTEYIDFYDLNNDHSRLKQYILGQYLQNLDDGWINTKAKYYRGSVQAEDEEEWGRSFLEWVFKSERFSPEKYFLLREAVKFIPHGEQSNLLLKIRTVSKNISDRQASFMDIRTKIHGRPGIEDIASVRQFKGQKTKTWNESDVKELNDLLMALEKYYSSDLAQQLDPHINRLTEGRIRADLRSFQEAYKQLQDTEEGIIRAVDLMELIRNEVEGNTSPSNRLTLMDISLIMEDYVLKAVSSWQPESLKKGFSLTCYLSQLSYATGHVYQWEYEELSGYISSIPEDEIALDQMMELFRAYRRNINWGSGLIVTEFGNTLDVYSSFEPMVNSFIDDRIRSSALLYMGQLTARFNDIMSEKAGWENKVLGRKSSSITGINPGYAKGKLVVIDQLEEEQVDPNAIYVFKKSPSDLQPVAGILSISEGNMVSHLQLLARNLGIPNANISESDFNTFQSYAGKEVFYAVSNRGGVLIKLAEDMNDEEQQLFAQKKVDEEIIRVPTEELQLNGPRVYQLNEVDASSSGKLCGPKAANFAKLKQLFPENLVDGLVIPFSIFRDHMNQLIPGQEISYWQYLEDTFAEIRRLTDQNGNDSTIESYTFSRLENLRNYIKVMPLKESFLSDLNAQFIKTMGKEIGESPVFLRSDTNMEDLKDFTGAGLNLTVFNTINKEKILQGIRDVWASPYTERSYRWRQKFLSNPEDVYPSILVIPSVFVDYSGVIITKDFIEGGEQRLNVAFSQGVGGAVDGQKSESWIMDPTGKNVLISPSRDRKFKSLNPTGGTLNQEASLNRRILTTDNMKEIWKMCTIIYEEMPKTGMNFPYDIELGFESNKLWLFQIRPFVENKKALSSMYLSQLDPAIPANIKFDINENIY